MIKPTYYQLENAVDRLGSVLEDRDQTIEILNGRLARLRREALHACGVMRLVAKGYSAATILANTEQLLRIAVDASRDEEEEAETRADDDGWSLRDEGRSDGSGESYGERNA